MTPDSNDLNQDWPKRPDGTRKTVGEMTLEEKIDVFRRAGELAARQMFSNAAMAERRMRHGRKIH
jgi:hypothetical protein